MDIKVRIYETERNHNSTWTIKLLGVEIIDAINYYLIKEAYTDEEALQYSLTAKEELTNL